MITWQILFKILLLIFLLSSMLGAGLGLTLQSLTTPLRNARLVLTAVALSFIAAPALALLLTRCLPLQPAHATGLLLLGCAGGAPFLPKLVEVSAGDVPGSIALMTLLTVGTTLFLPFALPHLAPNLQARAWDIASPLLVVILLPLVIGLILRRRLGSRVSRWQPSLGRLANLSGIVMLALLAIRNFNSMRSSLGTGAIASVVLLILGLFALGYLLGGSTPQSRGLMAISTGSRNVGAALVPVAQSGPAPDVMTMLVVGTLVMILVLLAAIGWLRYRASANITPHDA